jgi:hypothetical protein
MIFLYFYYFWISNHLIIIRSVDFSKKKQRHHQILERGVQTPLGWNKCGYRGAMQDQLVASMWSETARGSWHPELKKYGQTLPKLRVTLINMYGRSYKLL